MSSATKRRCRALTKNRELGTRCVLQRAVQEHFTARRSAEWGARLGAAADWAALESGWAAAALGERFAEGDAVSAVR